MPGQYGMPQQPMHGQYGMPQQPMPGQYGMPQQPMPGQYAAQQQPYNPNQKKVGTAWNCMRVFCFVVLPRLYYVTGIEKTSLIDWLIISLVYR